MLGNPQLFRLDVKVPYMYGNVPPYPSVFLRDQYVLVKVSKPAIWDSSTYVKDTNLINMSILDNLSDSDANLLSLAFYDESNFHIDGFTGTLTSFSGGVTKPTSITDTASLATMWSGERLYVYTLLTVLGSTNLRKKVRTAFAGDVTVRLESSFPIELVSPRM